MRAHGFVPAPKGMLWRDQRAQWHAQLRAAVGLVRTARVIKAEERPRYTKVPTETSPEGSRDQQAVLILRPCGAEQGILLSSFGTEPRNRYQKCYSRVTTVRKQKRLFSYVYA